METGAPKSGGADATPKAACPFALQPLAHAQSCCNREDGSSQPAGDPLQPTEPTGGLLPALPQPRAIAGATPSQPPAPPKARMPKCGCTGRFHRPPGECDPRHAVEQF